MKRGGGKRGSEADEGAAQKCPKCGAPRLGNAWDCRCGYLFDATGPAQIEDAERPAAAEPQPHGEPARRPVQPRSTAPSGSSARRPARASEPADGTPTRHTGLRGWVDQNLGLAIAAAVVAYLCVYAIIATQLVVSTANPTAITSQYRAIVGESPPTAFQPILGVSFVGRQVQTFANSRSGQFLLLYHEGWLAGPPDADRIAALPDSALGFLDVPYKNLGSRRAKMLHLPVELRVIDVQLAPNATMRGYVAFFTGNTDRPALLCLVGDSRTIIEMARTMFREE